MAASPADAMHDESPVDQMFIVLARSLDDSIGLLDRVLTEARTGRWTLTPEDEDAFVTAMSGRGHVAAFLAGMLETGDATHALAPDVEAYVRHRLGLPDEDALRAAIHYAAAVIQQQEAGTLPASMLDLPPLTAQTGDA